MYKRQNEDAYYLTENAFAFAASAMIPIGHASTAVSYTHQMCIRDSLRTSEIKTEYYFFKDLEHIVFIAFSVVKTMCFLVTISNSYSECG